MFQTCQFSDEQSEATEMSENIESEPPNRNPETISTSSRKRRNPELTQAKKQMDQAFNMISNISARREPNQVDLFCELLSKKIKKFNEASQEEIMDEIDALMFNKKRCVSHNEFYTAPSPQSGSSMSSVYSRNEFYAAPSPQSMSAPPSVSVPQPLPSPSLTDCSPSHTYQNDIYILQPEPKAHIIQNDLVRKAFATAHNDLNS